MEKLSRFFVLGMVLVLVSSPAAAEETGPVSNIIEGLIDLVDALLPDLGGEGEEGSYYVQSGFGDDNIITSVDSPGFFAVKKTFIPRQTPEDKPLNPEFGVKNIANLPGEGLVKVKVDNETVYSETITLEPDEEQYIKPEIDNPGPGNHTLVIQSPDQEKKANITVKKLPDFKPSFKQLETGKEGDNLTAQIKIENKGSKEHTQQYRLTVSNTEKMLIGEKTIPPGASFTRNISMNLPVGVYGENTVKLATRTSSVNKSIEIQQDVLGNLDEVIKVYKENGPPREQVNIVVHGDKIDGEKLKNKHMPGIIEAFNNNSALSHHREGVNWYYMDLDKRKSRDQHICGNSIKGENQGCELLRKNSEDIESSEKLNGGRVARQVISNRDFRSYAWRSIGDYAGGTGYTSIPYQPSTEKAYNTFIHELGHSIYGLDDEYQNPYAGLKATYLLPRNPNTYRNTWETVNSCKSDLKSLEYTNISKEDCECHRENGECREPVRIRGGKGVSFMESSYTPTAYENHVKRVKELVEENEELYN